nr:T9SS type A sorting domain-containing protein [Bacteroidota bacterium]
MPNQGEFADFGISKLASLEVMYCQYYSFAEGWNSISSYILPFDADVEVLFAPIVDELTIMRNLTSVYWPGENVNTIGNFDNTSGYALKVSEDVDFGICGIEFADNELTFTPGWHYLPVLSGCDVNTMDLFTGHLDDIVIVQDLIGSQVFWPDMGIYSLENLYPGNAYKIKVTNEFSITFPECDGKSITTTSAQKNNLSTHWGDLIMTPSTQVTAFATEAIEDFMIGDMIGAFGADNKLFGYLQINGTKQNQAIVLYGDDATTTLQNGFTEGQQIAFRLYRASTGEEFDLEVTYDQITDNSTGTYKAESFAIINKVKMSNTGINEMGEASIEIYPNPASEEITIKLNNSYTGQVGVKIIDSKGQVLVEKNFTNKTNLNVSTFSGGVYYVKINNENLNEVRKIVIK